MKAARRILAVVLILSLVFVLAACSDKKDKLVGTWQTTTYADENWYYLFESDGTCRYGLVSSDMAGSANGTYKVDGETLNVTINGRDGQINHTYQIVSVSDTELVLSEDGKTVTLKQK